MFLFNLFYIYFYTILWSQLFRVSWYVFRLGAFRNKPSWHWVPLNHISVQHLPQKHGLSDTLHPGKLTWHLKITYGNIEKEHHLPFTSMLGFQPLIFQGPKGMIFPSNMWSFDLRFPATLSQRHGWFTPLLTALSDATGSSSGTRSFLGSKMSCFLFVT